MLAIGAAGALAIVGTWIAIGSGPRAFGFGAPFVGMQTTGEIIGRTVFGLGAVIVLIYLIALTVGTVRKLFDAVVIAPATLHPDHDLAEVRARGHVLVGRAAPRRSRTPCRSPA